MLVVAKDWKGEGHYNIFSKVKIGDSGFSHNAWAVEKMNCVVLCHSTQRAGWERMIDSIYRAQAGKKDRGFVGPELCK